MREWILNYNLPVATIITKVDCLSSNNKIQQSISHVKKEFGGDVFPFSAKINRYNENILNFLLEK